MLLERRRGDRRGAVATVGLPSLALAALLLAAACNSGAKTPASVTTTAAPVTAQVTPVATPTAAGDQTPLQVQGLSDWYSVDVPVGWGPEDLDAPGGFIRRYVLIQDGARKAQITLQCQPGATIEAMMQIDARVIQGLHGQYPIGGSKPAAAGGLSGVQVDYEAVAGILIDSRAVYLAGKVCGWRIILQAYGAGQIGQYYALFDRVLPTFQPVHAGG